MFTLVSHWSSQPAEQRFMKVFRFHNRWIILQEGWKTFGVQETTTFIYDPNYVGDQVLFLEGETVFIFNDLSEYLSQCSLREDELFEGVPAPSWAVACRLT